MSQKLVIELSDDVFNAISRQASTAGTSPEQLAVASLERCFGASNGSAHTQPKADEAIKSAARERFERHFGAVDLGAPTGTDNDDIDADLAGEYGNPHEGT